MDHSLQGYLSRQTTEELDRILQSYLQLEHSELHDEIIRTIMRILRERELGFSERPSS